MFTGIFYKKALNNCVDLESGRAFKAVQEVVDFVTDCLDPVGKFMPRLYTTYTTPMHPQPRRSITRSPR